MPSRCPDLQAVRAGLFRGAGPLSFLEAQRTKNDEGSHSAEYLVLASLIAVVLIAAVFVIDRSVVNTLTSMIRLWI